MYYIGICDDDTAFIEYVKRLFLNKCKDITFFEYISGQALIEDMQNRDKLDCLILDVCMPEMDGNEAAGKFREWFPDTLLIFCSGVCMPTVDSFVSTPYRYWLKEYAEEKMLGEIEGVLNKLKQRKVMPYIMGKKEKQLVRLSPEQIYYIAIARKGSVIYCGNTEGKYSSSKKPAEFYKELKDFGFAYAHSSYIVNLKYVAKAGLKELQLMNGERLTVSRARAKDFLDAFTEELSKKYGED